MPLENDMATVPIDLAATQLPELFARVAAGEEVVIANGAHSGMKLVPTSTPLGGRRQPGTFKGLVSVPQSAFEPLPEEELRAWEGR